jgi:hypothetical protein
MASNRHVLLANRIKKVRRAANEALRTGIATLSMSGRLHSGEGSTDMASAPNDKIAQYIGLPDRNPLFLPTNSPTNVMLS